MGETIQKISDKNKRNTSTAQWQEEENQVTLEMILGKLDKIESTVNRLEQAAELAPEALSLATNLMDDTAGYIQENGQNLEERTTLNLQLLDRLSQPETVQKLNALLDLADQLPQIISNVTNMVDDMMGKAVENGIDLEERIEKLQTMVNWATSPKVLDKANAALEAVEQTDDMITFAVDQLDEFVMVLQNHGLDAKEMSEDGLKFLSMIVSAHHKVIQNPPQKVGLWDMFRTLSDPDFQKFLGFVTALGKNIGKGL